MYDLRQFILARITADGTKLPCDPAGMVINAHDPRHWMSYAGAKAVAEKTGFLASFVLTEPDPYFCIDIDHCLMPDGKDWSPLSKTVCAQFAGAMVEVSQSGKGLHIWGRSDAMPPHKCKNVKAGLELYTEKRFIILGHHPQGDPNANMTVPLKEFVNKYMAPGTNGAENLTIEWLAEPVSEWSGPTDDEELIKKAIATVGLGSLFRDNPVTFKDLWERNEDKLAAAFPDQSGARAYDESSADMSLAQRLAFWTGKNCQRVHDLMLRSALVREKWSERPDYLRRTVMNACAMQTRVYSERGAAAGQTGVSKKFAGGWVSSEEIPEVFEGCVYIVRDHKVLTPEGLVVTPDQFRTLYGGYKFSLDDSKTSRNAWEAFTQCPSWRPPTATAQCFRPELPPCALVMEGDETLVNIYRPMMMPREPGDVSRFTALMERAFPDPEDREILMSYMAALVQNPGTKFQWAPLLQGPEGNGKTFLLRCIAAAIGPRYCHTVNSQDIAGNGAKFNSWLFGKLFISIEEIRVGNKAEVMDALKPWISNDRVEGQGKGKDQTEIDNRANFILTSNYMDALDLNDDQRRFAPIKSGPQDRFQLEAAGLGTAFYADLWDWARGSGAYVGKTPGFHHISEYLHIYDVQERYNPAGQCNRAPRTTFYNEFLVEGAGRFEQEILEAIEEGRPGFRNGWVSSIMLDNLLRTKRMADKIPHKRRRDILARLNYHPHPGLRDGRATRDLMPDGGKPKLFVKHGIEAASIMEGWAVQDQYVADQTLEITGGDRVVPFRAMAPV